MRHLFTMGLLGAMIVVCGAMGFIELVSAYPALVSNIIPACGFGALSLSFIGGTIIWATR